jgi:hypothetical protein
MKEREGGAAITDEDVGGLREFLSKARDNVRLYLSLAPKADVDMVRLVQLSDNYLVLADQNTWFCIQRSIMDNGRCLPLLSLAPKADVDMVR